MKTRTHVVELISSIIKENVKKTKLAQRDIFVDTLFRPGYEEYLRSIAEMIFNLEYNRSYRAVFPPTPAAFDERAQRAQKAKAEEDEAVEVVKATITGRLLEMITANGKPLRECTGTECIKMGGFFRRIGERVGGTNLVSSIMTEADVRTLAEETYLKPSRTAPSSSARQAGARP